MYMGMDPAAEGTEKTVVMCGPSVSSKALNTLNSMRDVIAIEAPVAGETSVLLPDPETILSQGSFEKRKVNKESNMNLTAAGLLATFGGRIHTLGEAPNAAVGTPNLYDPSYQPKPPRKKRKKRKK